MAEIPMTGRDSIEAQADLFRRAKREFGLSVEVIAGKSPLKLSTLKGWASGRTAMPAWALGELHGAGVPTELLTVVFEPWHLHMLSDEEGGDHALDELTEAALDYTTAMALARANRGPGGPAVVPQEKVVLKKKAAKLATVARRAARGQ